jgi:hypothetical protein
VCAFAVLHLWAAAAALVDLYGDDACQLLLALPAAIGALSEFWHGLHKPPCVGHRSSIPPNGGGEEGMD